MHILSISLTRLFSEKCENIKVDWQSSSTNIAATNTLGIPRMEGC